MTIEPDKFKRVLADLANAETDRRLLVEQSRRQSAEIMQLHNDRRFLLAQIAKQHRKRQKMEQSIWRRLFKLFGGIGSSPGRLRRAKGQQVEGPELPITPTPFSKASVSLASSSANVTPDRTTRLPFINATPPSHTVLRLVAFYLPRRIPPSQTAQAFGTGSMMRIAY